jgi:hypothetical protein
MSESRADLGSLLRTLCEATLYQKRQSNSHSNITKIAILQQYCYSYLHDK